jgi:hypothetical protein
VGVILFNFAQVDRRCRANRDEIEDDIATGEREAIEWERQLADSPRP